VRLLVSAGCGTTAPKRRAVIPSGTLRDRTRLPLSPFAGAELPLRRRKAPTQTQTLERDETERKPARLYNVIVYNCDCHSFDDVTFGLMRIVGTGMRDAELKAKEVDFFGQAVVATADLEVAELYAARLHDEVVSLSGTLLRTSVQPG
jgi:ATP-dependent Clp protease adapter protein ClpS